MATKKYLDYAGLKRVLAKLLPGARKIWHGTLAEWKALSEAERDKYDQAEIIDGSGYQTVSQTKTGTLPVTKTGTFPVTKTKGRVNSNCVLTEGTWFVFVGLMFHPDHLQGDVALTIGNIETGACVRCTTLSKDIDNVNLVDIVTIAEGESKAVGINIMDSPVVNISDSFLWNVKAVRVA